MIETIIHHFVLFMVIFGMPTLVCGLTHYGIAKLFVYSTSQTYRFLAQRTARNWSLAAWIASLWTILALIIVFNTVLTLGLLKMYLGECSIC